MAAMKRIPSGLPSLDPIIGGGFPAGSMVLLLGESGGGQREFALTAAIMTATKKVVLSTPMGENVVLPERICYVSFARTKEDVFSEIANSFSSELYEIFQNKVTFKDMSKPYSQALEARTSGASEKIRKKAVSTIAGQLFTFLNEKAKNSVVILHSLTDLARLFIYDPQEFNVFLMKLQHSTKEWDGLVYAVLSKDVLPKNMEEEAVVASDGVIEFGWETSQEERERTMYFRKFRSLLPHIEDRIGKFRVNVTTSTGFVVSKIRIVKALR
jgi:KaiC/GvpD/RAD55 family RecA-like ATPase